MKLAKHKLAKNPRTHGAKKVERSKKHKKTKNIALLDNNDVEMADANEDDQENNSSADENSISMDGEESGKKPAERRLKSKEEKKLIRQLRKKTNIRRNLYKQRKGNFTGKNGPRAINRAVNI